MTETMPNLPVLVVEDSPFSRKLLEHALSGNSYSLLLAENGKEALQLFKEHRPAIVITDWMLPDSSGPELCERIRAESNGSYTYIILLTSMTEKEDIVRGLSSGADDYLTKPFDRGELLARIGVGRRMIGLHREIDTKNKLLEEMAHTDPLTGLPNRRAIEEWAKRQLRGAARHGYSLWVVHMDLDGFKNINDSYGHEAGDQVLLGIARVLKEHTRASDIGGRMGGDEFLFVMTHVEKANIPLTVERLRQKIASLNFCLGGKSISVTASFGVCGFQGKEPPEFSLLVRQADNALYDAKRGGRNQVKIESLGILVP
jgi:two-component system, cell cycle response regulator